MVLVHPSLEPDNEHAQNNKAKQKQEDPADALPQGSPPVRAARTTLIKAVKQCAHLAALRTLRGSHRCHPNLLHLRLKVDAHQPVLSHTDRPVPLGRKKRFVSRYTGRFVMANLALLRVLEVSKPIVIGHDTPDYLKAIHSERADRIPHILLTILLATLDRRQHLTYPLSSSQPSNTPYQSSSNNITVFTSSLFVFIRQRISPHPSGSVTSSIRE